MTADRKQYIVGIVLIAVAMILILMSTMAGPLGVGAAPMEAAITPITRYAAEGNPRIVNFWGDATALTADTRSSCFDLSGYNSLDLQWVIDQGAGVPNTTTFTLQFTNDGATFSTGQAFVTSNSADANDLQPYQIYGRYTCIYADVSNSNAVSITAIGVAK